MEQKIKQDAFIPIGENIRKVRKAKGIGQTELVRQLQLLGVEMTRETLVKIERGIQHIQAQQLQAIRDVLETTYDELLMPQNIRSDLPCQNQTTKKQGYLQYTKY